MPQTVQRLHTHVFDNGIDIILLNWDRTRHVPLHICNSEEKVDPSCAFSGRMNLPCLVCWLFKAYSDSTRQQWAVSYGFESCCGTFKPVSSGSFKWPTFPGCAYLSWKEKSNRHWWRLLWRYWPSALSGQIKSRTFNMPVMVQKPFFCCHVDSLKGVPLTPLVDVGTSILFDPVSTIRLVMVHGVSTLRIKCWISEISVHKISTKWCFFVSHSSVCLVTTSIWTFYGKLDCNSATRTGPIPNTPFLIPVQGVKYNYDNSHHHNPVPFYNLWVLQYRGHLDTIKLTYMYGASILDYSDSIM